MINIISYQGNINQNHNEIALHLRKNKCWQGWREIGTLSITGGNINGSAVTENSLAVFQRRYTELPYNQAILPLGTYPQKTGTQILMHPCSQQCYSQQ